MRETILLPGDTLKYLRNILISITFINVIARMFVDYVLVHEALHLDLNKFT